MGIFLMIKVKASATHKKFCSICSSRVCRQNRKI
jgi:hypothetical protein